MENYQAPPKSKTKAYIQTAGLLFILLVLPLGSWYYLSSGLKYQKSARAELKDYGAIPPFSFNDQDGNIITSDSLKGKMILASFVKPGATQNAAKFEILKALHEQFDDRKRVLFIQYLLPSNDNTILDVKQFIEAMDFKDLGQIFYLSGGGTMEVLSQGYKMPKAGLEKNEEGKIGFESKFPDGLEDYPYFILIDKNGRISSYCDSRDRGQVKRLVEHMALAMPRER